MNRQIPMIAACALVIAACGAADTPGTSAASATTTAPQATTSAPTPATTTTTPPEAVTGSGLTAVESDFGPILADADGLTVYIFLPDDRSESTCYGDCEAAWPPVSSPVSVTGDVDEGLVGETTRTDGTIQATYDGWPLYYFASDQAPGDTNGQGRGTVWYVVAPDGTPMLAADEPVHGLTVVESDFGPILADGSGNTLYIFIPDAQGDSTCYDQCEASWPVLQVPTIVGEGLDRTLVDSAERTDGTVQVTYDGWPLYYFANDSAPGDTNGQGRGEVWYVIAPDGRVVEG